MLQQSFKHEIHEILFWKTGLGYRAGFHALRCNRLSIDVLGERTKAMASKVLLKGRPRGGGGGGGQVGGGKKEHK